MGDPAAASEIAQFQSDGFEVINAPHDFRSSMESTDTAFHMTTVRSWDAAYLHIDRADDSAFHEAVHSQHGRQQVLKVEGRLAEQIREIQILSFSTSPGFASRGP